MKPVTGYIDDLFTDRALDFIGRRKDRALLPLHRLHRHPFPHRAPADEVEHTGASSPSLTPPPVNATYAAMVTRLDKDVGRVLEALDEHGLTEEHADRLHQRPRRDVRAATRARAASTDSNRPFRGQSGPWEGGVRVPASGTLAGTGHGGVVSRRSSTRSTSCRPSSPPRAAPRSAWKVDG